MDTSGKALVNHWTWAADKGLMNGATAASLKSACAKVIGILDDWEEVDVKSIDVEHTIERFQNLHARDFTPSSLETYASRFRKAVGLFMEFTTNPAGWRVSGRTRRQKPKEEARKNGANQTEAPSSNDSDIKHSNHEDCGRDDVHLISYPFPLRRGITVKLSLPDDLTTIEARRLSAFLLTLASDFTDNHP